MIRVLLADDQALVRAGFRLVTRLPVAGGGPAGRDGGS